MSRLLKITVILLFLIWINPTYAQLDTLIKRCSGYIKFPFISDGQEYRALVVQGETAEFYVTFYGQATYRIAACTGDGTIAPIFRVYDKNRKLLYSSEYYNNPHYWDFRFESTIEAIIEAELPVNGPQSGFIIMFIGFK